MFDPSKAEPGEAALPSGEYLLAMISFERKFGRESRRPYIRAKFKAFSGPCKGRTFFAAVGVDLTSPGIRSRLALYCKCVGQSEPWDPEDDRQFGDVFLGKPFKASVKTTQNGDYTNNDIARFLPELSAREEAACDAFWTDWVDRQEGKASDGFSDDEGDDDDADAIPF